MLSIEAITSVYVSIVYVAVAEQLFSFDVLNEKTQLCLEFFPNQK